MIKECSAGSIRRPFAAASVKSMLAKAGKCEGRKSHAERNPELVALAKRLHRQKPKGGRMSLRAISADLAARGIMNERGRPFSAASINSMLESRSLLARKI